MVQDNSPTSEVSRVTRYALTIVFEELYTQNDTQLRAAADAIGDVVMAIEQRISQDSELQELLMTHNLTLRMIAPVRGTGQPEPRR